MPTHTVGYDLVTLAAKDYTTVASAISAATAGDTLELHLGQSNGNGNFSELNLDISKNLSFTNGLAYPHRARLARGSNHYFFQQATGGVTATFTDITMGGQKGAFYVPSSVTSGTFNFKKCVIDGNIGVEHRGGGTVACNLENCLVIGCQYGVLFSSASASATLGMKNCSLMGCALYNAYQASSGVATAQNCVNVIAGIRSWFGTWSGNNNAADDQYNVGTSAVDLRVQNTYLMYHGSNGYTAYDPRPVNASSPVVGAGADLSLTEDIDGQAINQSVSANIGCYGVTVPLSTAACAAPSTPSVVAVDDGDAANATLTISGSDASTTNKVYQWQAVGGWVQSDLTSGGSNNAQRTGDGVVQIAIAPGFYHFRVDSIDGSNNQATSELITHTQASTSLLDPERALWKLLADDASVGGVCGDRIYSQQPPETVKFPFIVYTRTSNEHHMHMLADSGLAQARVQVDMVAETHAEMRDLENKVRKALSGYRGTVTNTDTIVVRGIHLESEDTEFVSPLEGGSRGLHVGTHVYMIGYRENVNTF